MAPVSFANFWNQSQSAPQVIPTHPPCLALPTSAAFDSPPSPTGIYLAQLPVELQFLVLTHLPIRSISRGLARTSHHWARTVDEHLRRQILRFVGDPRSSRACALVFEAQRPIDTLTHKHRLYFSHYGVTNSTGGAYTTTANFSFIPIEEEHGLPRKDDWESAASQDKGQPETHDPSRPAPHQDGSSGSGIESRPAVLRNLPPHLAGRVRAEHCTSSVIPESTSGIAIVEGSRGRQAASSRASRAVSPIATHTPTVMDAIHYPLDAYDWAGPISSSVRIPSTSRSATRSDLDSGLRRKKHNKPTYRMQLDPLDSFETWILTLSVRVSSSDHRKTDFNIGKGGKGTFSPTQRFDGVDRISFETMGDGPTQAASIGPPSLELSRAMRWERRVAEGLDRVYRDWFHRPEPTEPSIGTKGGAKTTALDESHLSETRDEPLCHRPTAAVTPELLSTFGAVNTAFGGVRDDKHGRVGPCPPPPPSSSPSTVASLLPRRRVLEFDNSSCILHLQPHSCSSPQLLALHPTLAYFYTPTSLPITANITGPTAVSSSYPPPAGGRDDNLGPRSNPSTSSSPSSSAPLIGDPSSWASIANSHSRYHALHSRLQSSHRVELTWHAESIEVNAARLLSVLEEVEGERWDWEKRNGIRGTAAPAAVLGRERVVGQGRTASRIRDRVDSGDGGGGEREGAGEIRNENSATPPPHHHHPDYQSDYHEEDTRRILFGMDMSTSTRW